MGIKSRNFQILFLFLSLGSIVISTVVFFAFAYQVGSDSIKNEAMRTVGVAADGKYNNLANRLGFQKRTLDNFLAVEEVHCEGGHAQRFESCLNAAITQFFQVQKVKALYFATSDQRMVLQLGVPSGELSFDPKLKTGQLARFYDGGKANPYFVIQSETADKKERIVVEFPVSSLADIFVAKGLGQDGESFLVDGKGFFLTSHKYHVAAGTSHPIDAKPMVMCLGGQSGEIAGLDYAGIPIIHGFRYVPEIGGGCIMVHINERMTFAQVDAFKGKWLSAAMIMWAVLGTISYIVSRRLADQFQKSLNLQETAETKYHALFDQSPDGVLLLDPSNGRFVDFSENAHRQLGYTREEFALLPVSDFEEALSPEEIQKHIAKMLAEGFDIFETKLRTKDGDIRNVQVIAKAINLEGKPYIHVIHRDITVQKEHERRIRERETLFRGIFENAPIGITLHLAEGPCQEANEAVARSIGGSREQVLRQNFRELDAWRRFGLLDAALRSLDAGESVHFETNAVTTFGKRIVINCLFTPIEINGRQHLLSLFNDISHLREAEAQMKEAKEEAERANKMKDKFITLVSHDLKSPFVSITTLAESIKHDASHALSPKLEELVNEIQSISGQSIEMINELLSLHRLKTGRITPQWQFADAHSIALLACMQHRHLAESKGISLANNIPRHSWIYCDPSLVAGVIHNLMNNAVKYCGNGKSITLFIPPGRNATVAVKDSGTGISPEILPHIFKEGVVALMRGTPGEEKSGMGLPTCYEVIKAHGGSLAVESREGEGSVFYVELPYVKPSLLLVSESGSTISLFQSVAAKYDIDLVLASNIGDAKADGNTSKTCMVIVDMENAPQVDINRQLKHLAEDKESYSLLCLAIMSEENYISLSERQTAEVDQVLFTPLTIEKVEAVLEGYFR